MEEEVRKGIRIMNETIEGILREGEQKEKEDDEEDAEERECENDVIIPFF